MRLLERVAVGADYTTHFADDDPALGLVLVAPARGEIVALQGDRPRTGGRPHQGGCSAARFFPSARPHSPAPGAPLVPVFNFRAGRFRFRVARQPIRVPAPTFGARAIAEARIAGPGHRMGDPRTPHQWFCFRRLWS